LRVRNAVLELNPEPSGVLPGVMEPLLA
jgi:hypothetical protein